MIFYIKNIKRGYLKINRNVTEAGERRRDLFGTVKSAAIIGIDSHMVSVEADVSDGLPGFSMVGYLASEVREAQDRVRTALRNSGYQLQPRKITVNLAPGDIRKSGTGFDLPIALAVMVAYGYFPQKALNGIFFAGELSLDGSVQGIRGILGMVMEAKLTGCAACMVPQENVVEAAAVGGIEVYGVRHLRELANHLNGGQTLEKVSINIEEKFQRGIVHGSPDFADIHGQKIVKRAAEIAAGGMHNLLISGPPGSGKSMTAKCIPSILPLLTLEESLEVSRIHSVAGTLPKEGILTSRPFRMPHHTVSSSALAGGGVVPHPGEISLAHRGVLYLDELPEFQKETLEILRQPLEDAEVRISRNSGNYIFPADFMLVASRNPCKCGYYPDRGRCTCREGDVRRYLSRISRPLLDRIDLHVQSEQIRYQDLVSGCKEEDSASIRMRVEMVHGLQQKRYQGKTWRFNSEIPPSALEEYCMFGKKEKERMADLFERKHLTARAYHRMLRVARTIADTEGEERVTVNHLNEAFLYRPDEYLM